jgi:acid phosphatase (class A)
VARRSRLLCAGLLAAILGACSSVDSVDLVAEEVPEIRPGILQGYLPMDAPLNSKLFVPPPPQQGSARQELDDQTAKRSLALRGTPRWELAVHDAHLDFPGVADTFSCAMQLPISEEQTPALYMLLRRTLADVGLATYPAKTAYQRTRPFVVNGEPICTPDEREELSHDGSYPSGHTSIGWGWALILSELDPEHAAQILARGRAFGESRNVCNVHWHSDVVAGRMVAGGAVATLHANQQFIEAMAAAKSEIADVRARELPVGGDCEAQQRALSYGQSVD